MSADQKALEDAIAALRRDPSHPVRANVDGMEVELRAVPETSRPTRLGDWIASLGPWEGETQDVLLARLREARQQGGSAEPPTL